MGDDSSAPVQRGECGLLDDISIVYSPVGPTYPYPSRGCRASPFSKVTTCVAPRCWTLSPTQMMAAANPRPPAINSDGYI